MTNKHIYIQYVQETIFTFSPFSCHASKSVSSLQSALHFLLVCIHEKGAEALRSLLTKGKSELCGFCMCCILALLMIVKCRTCKVNTKEFLTDDSQRVFEQQTCINFRKALDNVNHKEILQPGLCAFRVQVDHVGIFHGRTCLIVGAKAHREARWNII